MARSDSSYAARTAFRFQSSVVDDAWLHEGLSDDDVDLPREVLNSTLDNEEDDEDEEGVTPFGEETWNDLALDSFLQHLESSEANASQSASTVAASPAPVSRPSDPKAVALTVTTTGPDPTNLTVSSAFPA